MLKSPLLTTPPLSLVAGAEGQPAEVPVLLHAQARVAGGEPGVGGGQEGVRRSLDDRARPASLGHPEVRSGEERSEKMKTCDCEIWRTYEVPLSSTSSLLLTS